MAASDTGRKLLFALAIGALIAWVLVLGLTTSGEGGSKPRRAGAAGPPSHSAHAVAQVPGDRGRSAVAQAAMDFTDVYLGYEVGELDRSARRALIRLATPQLASQLLAQRPRIPAAGAPPREWASRVEAVHVGIFGGAPALLASVLVVGVNGPHVLTPTFVERGTRWRVAGIGA